MHKVRGREPRMIHRKVFLEITTNGVSTMVFVQREHKEHLAEKEMSDTPKHCTQNLFRQIHLCFGW